MALTQISTGGIKDTTIDTADIANDAVDGTKLADNIDIAGTLDVTGEAIFDNRIGIGVTSTNRTLDIQTASNDNGFCLNCIGTPANYAFDIRDDGTVLYRVDNAGRVLIGTETEGEATADNLTIADAGHCGITLRSGDDDVGTIFFSDATSGGDEYIGSIQYDHSGNFLKWTVNGSERMRIDSAGAITVGARSGIHATNALARFGIDCQDYDSLASDANNVENYGLAFYNSSTSNEANGIGFFNDDGTTCGGYIVHQDKGGSNIGDLVFGTASSANTPVERMRIESSGKVIVSGQCDATCFTGDSGTSYGYTEISSSNATVTTGWTQVDSSHEWDLPGAGVYKLEASVRVRVDDVTGFIKARYSGSAANGLPLMLFETDDSDTMYNSNAHIMWVYTATGADTVELQFASSVNDVGLSIQNDVNGRAFMLWTRIG